MPKSTFPKGGYTILAGEFLERFSFWGLQSIIVLYLINNLHYSNSESVLTQATLTSLSFLFAIIGGLLADRFVGPYFSVKLGTIFTIAGNLMLAMFSHPQTALFGLASISLGAGLFIPNNPNLLSSLYKEGSVGREYAFTLLYFCTNLGGTLAPVVYGLLAKYQYWNSCFYLSSFLILCWYLFFYRRSKYLKNIYFNIGHNTKKYSLLFFGILSLSLTSYVLMNYPNLTGATTVIILLLAGIFIITQLKEVDRAIWKTVAYLFLMIFCCMWFFSFEFQTNNSFLLFVNDLISKNIGVFDIPVPFFAAFEPLCVVLLAPLFARLWLIIKSRTLNTSFVKIIIGLFLECLAFYWIAYIAFLTMQNITPPSPIWLIPLYLLLGGGELLVMPIVISTITGKSPEKLKGTFLGLLYLSLSSSAYISGIIATTAVTYTTSYKGATYYYSYLNVAHISALVIIVLGFFLTIPYIHKLAKRN